MFLIFIIFIMLLLNVDFYGKRFNRNYLSKDNTTTINGFFIIMVFFSHFQQYILVMSSYDLYFYKIIGYIGQLMVTTFFFFSGYGIYESVKKKGENYIKNFFNNRFVPTYINWSIILIVYVVLNIIMGGGKTTLSYTKIILSFIGWDSIGNSNWYMFDIFILYLFFIIVFNAFKKNSIRIISFTLLTIIFILLLSVFKDSYWYNTLLCFPFGIIYSYFKEKLDGMINNNRNYLIALLIILLLFVASYLFIRVFNNDILYNIVACSFVLLIVMVLMKFKLKSCILHWFGKNLFWIYIIQRIPMIVFNNKINNNYLYFMICFISTIIMVLFINYINKKIKKGKG